MMPRAAGRSRPIGSLNEADLRPTREKAELSGSTPPGWYDDGHGALRWWDGSRWTEHTHAPVEPEPEAESQPEEPPAVTEASLAESQHGVAASDTASPTDALPPIPPSPGGFAPVYPGAHPSIATAAVTGAVGETDAAPPRRSRLWIVFVALGVVLVGLVVLAAVFIPRFIVGILDPSSDRPGATAVQGADLRAAEDIVDAYDDAWDEMDCAAYQAILTPEFLASGGLSDCADFAQAAREFNNSVEDYEVSFISTTREGDTIYVETVETFTQTADAAGAPLENPVPASFSALYTLVPGGSGWLIDDYVEQ